MMKLTHLPFACAEIFDETLEIIDSLTFHQRKISPNMWRIFECIYLAFKNDGIDYLEGSFCLNFHGYFY
jgi:hypothetical protein